MLRVTQSRQVWWPVTVNVPVDGGQTEPFEIRVLFELMDTHQVEAHRQAGTPDVEVLASWAKGWEGVADEQGNLLPFSPENLAAVARVPYIGRAMVVALLQASAGAKVKNSEPGSDGISPRTDPGHATV